ncbi:MAG: DinB family protein, partial [Acidobacteria bacterium]|nr:DinB family protein [Acidobacteriota bacterium]
MEYKTISDVFAANDKIHKNFVDTVKDLSDEQAQLPSENGKWTVQMLVEHVAIVHQGITRISAKLLSKAEAAGAGSDGSVNPSGTFLKAAATARAQKFEAPDAIAPTGSKTIAESLASIESTFNDLNALRTKFEDVDGTGAAFPHPVFGDM